MYDRDTIRKIYQEVLENENDFAFFCLMKEKSKAFVIELFLIRFGIQASLAMFQVLLPMKKIVVKAMVLN